MAKKTLNNFIDEGVTLYPDGVDEATKATVVDWFGYRVVAHDTYFPNWFYRTISRDYPRYMELLRIEARTAGSEYDWLVTNYEERQVETKGNDTTVQTGTDNINQSNNRTFTAGTSEVITRNDKDTSEGQSTAKHTGTDTNLMTRNLAHNGSERNQIDATGTNETTRTPDLKTTNKTSNTDSNRHGVMERQAPYDADYAGLDASTNSNVAHGVNGDGVDVGSPELINNSSYMAGFPALVLRNPTASRDEYATNSGVNYGENETTGNEKTDTETTDKQDNHTTINNTDTGTENNQKTLNLTDTEQNENETTRVGRTESAKSGSDTDVTVLSGNTTKNSNIKNDRSNLERTISTGRTGQSPQFLLRDAVEFIKGTSAWLWLYRQLDKCFMMCYDIDEYEEV